VRTKAKQSQSEDATVQMPEEPERPEKPMELIKPPRMNGECACVWFSRGQRLRVALHQGKALTATSTSTIRATSGGKQQQR